jgi:acylphosphatase
VKTHARLFIDGRVQGVAYRYFVREAAERLGLSGWVRNLPDGRVEAVFEGQRSRIEEAIRMCTEGPPFERVTSIDTTWEDRIENLTDFQIRR